jgi:formylmethanofuran dehydrogenase subunit E
MKTFETVVEFHGHSCPGLALGYRVALRALEEFKRRAEDEELVAVVENNSCAVDAVQVMTGCTFGKGNLIYHDYGKQVYTFIKRPSGKYLRISISRKKPAEPEKERQLWEKYMKGDRSKTIIDFVHAKKSSKIRHILTAEEHELMTVTTGKMEVPERAMIRPSVVCSSCGEKVMDLRAKQKNGPMLCIPCCNERKFKVKSKRHAE